MSSRTRAIPLIIIINLLLNNFRWFVCQVTMIIIISSLRWHIITCLCKGKACVFNSMACRPFPLRWRTYASHYDSSWLSPTMDYREFSLQWKGLPFHYEVWTSQHLQELILMKTAHVSRKWGQRRQKVEKNTLRPMLCHAILWYIVIYALC